MMELFGFSLPLWNCSVGFYNPMQIEVRKSATLAERRQQKFAPPQSLLRHKVQEESQERIPKERV
ncbi:MAG: hypothetical protein DMG49_08110 [Acidobacteria bacterium]|nr:MAG: hypothetical protein DMG49_08110 [Acidobacteriota bacterium]